MSIDIIMDHMLISEWLTFAAYWGSSFVANVHFRVCLHGTL